MGHDEWNSFVVFLLVATAAAAGSTGDPAKCFPSIQRCGEGEPNVTFPFRISGRQPPSCGCPGFLLTCSGNRTIFNVPNSGAFYVEKIEYSFRSMSMRLKDPQNCTIRLLMNSPSSLQEALRTALNQTKPFYLHEYMQNVSLFNCRHDPGTSGYYGFYHVGCLDTESGGGSGEEVYVVFSNITSLVEEPPWCEKMVNFSGSIMYYDREDDSLTWWWKPADCTGCLASSQMCGFNYADINAGRGLKGTSVMGIVIVFSASLAAAFYYWNDTFSGTYELDQYKIDRFLESYQSLQPNRYSYSEVKKMTNRFREKLGQGGFGSVYKGRLPNGVPVAVKTIEMSKSSTEGEEFINEMAAVGQIHHVNVVRLLGFCADQFRRALVYEFMPNGSLEKFIFSTEPSKREELGWEKMQEIAVGIARGIEYLHQGCDQRILHFDIKPHNILLDHKFTPKISDFGLAKFCSKDQSIISMTTARGTMGYIAPEVASRNFGNISYKSDVYSFGMLLLEMVGKRKNIDVSVENTSQICFPEWIYHRIRLRYEELDTVVPEDQDEDRIARKLTIVGLWCIQWNPNDRPNMKKVVSMLGGSIETLEIPPSPFLPDSIMAKDQLPMDSV